MERGLNLYAALVANSAKLFLIVCLVRAQSLPNPLVDAAISMWDIRDFSDESPQADRFVSQKIASWSELQSHCPFNMGKCWVHIPVCTLNPVYAGIGDEFHEAYSEFGVGESEQACLSRAEYHWELCGSNPFHQVIMTFLPSGATASFPDDATVERHYSSRHAFYRLAKWVGTDKVRHLHQHGLITRPAPRCGESEPLSLNPSTL